MSSTLIDAAGIARRHGDRTILSAIDVRIAYGDRVALVGDNGSGKSTLLAILAGREEPDTGRVERSGTMVYLPQLGREGVVGPTLDDVQREPAGHAERGNGPTVREQAAASLGVAAAARDLDRAEAGLGAGTERAIATHAAALERWMNAGGATAEADLDAAARRVGLDPSLLDRPVKTLSSGQGLRAALLPLAARRHDVVLLDEPTNYLDRAGRVLLQQLLAAHRGALVVASHDRAFLDEHVDRVVELDPRGGAASEYSGGWSAYEREADIAQRAAQAAFDQATARRAELIAAEREIRRRAAATQNKVAKAPKDGDKHVREWFAMRADGVQARGAVVGARAARIDVPAKPWKEAPLALELTHAEQRSAYVVALQGAVVQRDAWTSPELDLTVAPGERILLRGPNGSGKSTLLGALAGTLVLAKGVRRVGPRTVVSVLGAVEVALRSDRLLVDVVRELAGLDPADARGRLAQVGLGPDAAGRPASSLSPGERTRAELAILGAARTTCLLLDEPSNHLDRRSLIALEAALDRWPGALVVATHDERFGQRLRPTREVELPGP